MNHTRRTILSVVASLPLFSRIGFGTAFLDLDPPAFEAGETLEYRLAWAFVTAGHATLKVLPDEEIDGEKVRSFMMTASTNQIADPFFKVRDKLFSLAAYDMSRSLGYSKLQREGKTNRDVSVEFDWKNLTAHYQETVNGTDLVIPVPENTLDPLSAFYFVRMRKLDVGTIIRGPLTDGKKCKIAEITVVSRERIKVGGKKYDTFKLIPDFKDVGGVFDKSEDASVEIWVTTDHRHIPVRMKSKVAVGSFVAELDA